MTDLAMGPFAEGKATGVEVRETVWVRARRSGIFRGEVKLGDTVPAGATLGTIADAFGDRAIAVRAPHEGLVIGLELNPPVNRGDALVHLGTPMDAAPPGSSR
jgi:predicted deacylase